MAAPSRSMPYRRNTGWPIFLGLALCAMSSPARAVEPADDQPTPGEILVQLRGPLMVTTQDVAPPPGHLPEPVNRTKLVAARVAAGGGHVELDWRHSQELHDELFYWRFPRHGDLRQVHAVVTGRLEFRLPEPQAADAPPAGHRSRPVVVVDSLFVQLVGPDGRPAGRQLRRKGVVGQLSSEKPPNHAAP